MTNEWALKSQVGLIIFKAERRVQKRCGTQKKIIIITITRATENKPTVESQFDIHFL